MAEDLFLIAHLVRGKPTFDIAIQMRVGEEDWWILPTTGHRAWPYWFVKLETEAGEAPLGHPDFYSYHNRAPKKVAASGQSADDLLKELGL